MRIFGQRTNAQVEPLGVPLDRLSFSWLIDQGGSNDRQTSYQIQLSESADDRSFTEKLYWDSGPQSSHETLDVVYFGPKLKSLTQYWWRVRSQNQLDQWSDWSDTSSFTTNLEQPTRWMANWIGPAKISRDKQKGNPAVYYRGQLELTLDDVDRAYLMATCHGVYTAFLNGKRVAEDRLRPGFTSYRDRLQYQFYDVREYLRDGMNVCGVVVTDGWYRGKFGLVPKTEIFGNDNALLLQILITTLGGRTLVLKTDQNWSWTDSGPIKSCDFSDGEVYDARHDLGSWTDAGYDDKSWLPVSVRDHTFENLVPQRGGSVVVQEEITAKSVKQVGPGRYVFDLGQNIGGIFRIRVNGTGGQELNIRYSEVLKKDGSVNQLPYMFARQSVKYTCAGNGIEQYEPRHLSHGFRYIEIDGLKNDPTVDMVVGLALSTKNERTARFDCSDRRVHQLSRNIYWSQQNNFIEIPTDCPHREKMGWTGDIQVFVRTACYNMDVREMLGRWLEDLAAEYRRLGHFPNVVPEIYQWKPLGLSMTGSSGFIDAAAVLPWTLYRFYGDRQMLLEGFPLMNALVDFYQRAARQLPTNLLGMRSESDPHIVDTGFHFGDWLAPGVNPAKELMASLLKIRRQPDWLSTAFYARAVDLTRRAARVLGSDRQSELDRLWQEIRASFQKRFVNESGLLNPDKQAAYVLALEFGLIDESVKQNAADRLAQLIEDAEFHLDTGFLATAYICNVLTNHNHLDTAYRLLMQDTHPSWLYQVDLGATSMWEFWDSVKADGTYRTGSLNHYAFGSIGGWLYEHVAGISQSEQSAGFQEILIAPKPNDLLKRAEATFKSVRGPIKSGWEIDNGRLRIDVEIPYSKSAVIRLPNAQLSDVTVGGETLSKSKLFDGAVQQNGYVEVDVNQGVYQFDYDWLGTQEQTDSSS